MSSIFITISFIDVYGASVGYKLRRHIAKALNRRGATLLNALQRYNKAARSLSPPRPTVTREQVLDIAFLADFPVLREDVGAQDWAQPTLRHLTLAWAETARAHEEVARLRVEATRVRTWVYDEEANLDAHIATLKASNNHRSVLLAKELDYRAQILYSVHSAVLADLHAFDIADGQKEPRRPGRRVGDPALARPPMRQPYRVQMAPLEIRPPSAHIPADTSRASPPATDLDEYDGEDDYEPLALEENEQNELDGLLQVVDAITRT